MVSYSQLCFIIITIVMCAYATDDTRVLGDDMKVLKDRLDSLEQELRQVKSSCKNDVVMSKASVQKRQQPGTKVAFSAVLEHGQVTTSHNQPVKYDKVYTNIGLGYDNKTGVFRVPETGLYQLYASVAVDGDDAVHAFLESNGVVYCACTATHYSTGSCMVIIPLEEGDSVWVREVFGVHVRGTKLSTFTGVLL